jgi:hypothetical protein
MLRPVRVTSRILTAVAVLLLFPLLASAVYVVVLKDGTRINAREKFKVQGDLALITLPNGTVTQIQVAKIDQPASEKATSMGVADAVPLAPAPVPGAGAATGDDRKGPSLQDLAKQRRLKEQQAKTESGARTPGAAKGSASQVPFPDRDIANTFFADLEKAGLSNIGTFQGATKATLRIEMTADREEQVFAAITAVGKRYQELKSSTTSAPERIELSMKTATGENAGSFSVSIDEIAPLMRGEISVQEFFIRNVLL